MSSIDKQLQLALAAEQKLSSVSNIAEIKKAQLDPQAAQRSLVEGLSNLSSLREYNRNSTPFDEIRNEVQAVEDADVAGLQRNAADMAGDTLINIATGTEGLAQGASYAKGLVDEAAAMPGRWLAEQILGDEVAAQLPRNPNSADELLTALDLPTPSSLGRDLRDWGESFRSSPSQLNKELVARLIEEGTAQSATQMQEEIAAGRGQIGAQLRRLGRDFVTGASETLDNSTALTDFAVQQVPTLALGGVGRGAAAPAAVERIVAQRLAAASAERIAAGGTPLLPREAAKLGVELTEQVTNQLQRRAMAGATGVTEGGSAGFETREEILSRDFETLFRESARFRDMMGEEFVNNPDATYTGDNLKRAEQAREQLARESAAVATAIVAPVAGVVGRFASEFELAPLGRGARSLPGSLGRSAATVGQEVGEEAIQGAAGEFGGNLAERTTGTSDNNDLSAGVGAAAGQGAAVAGVFSGAFQTPAIARETTAGMFRAGLDLGSETLRMLDERATKREKVTNEKAKADAVEMGNALSELPSVKEVAAQPLPVTAMRDYLASASKPGVTGETVFNTLEESHQNLRASKGDDPQADLLNLAMLRMSTLQARQIYEAIAERPNVSEDEKQSLYRAAYNPEVEEQIAMLDDIPSETLVDLFESIGSEDAEKSAAATEMTMALITMAPERVTVEAAEKIVAQNVPMTPVQRSLFETVIADGKVNETYESKIEAIKASSGLKTALDVRNDIRETGFTGDKSGERKSLRQYFRDVGRAVSENRLDDAMESLALLKEFANHLVNRAGLFDDAVLEGIERDSASADVVGTQTFDKTEGKVVDKPFKIYMGNAASRAVVDVVHADAEVAAQTFNVLAQKFPELGAVAMELPQQTAPGVADAAGARTQRLSNQINKAANKRQNVVARNNNGRVELIADESRPFTKRQKKAKVFREDGSQLSDREVKSMIGGKAPKAPAKAKPKVRNKKVEKKDPITEVVEQNAVEDTIRQKADAAKKQIKPKFKDASEVTAAIKGGQVVLRHSDNNGEHTIEGFIDGESVGTLTYDAANDTALDVDIEPEFRRRGIAQTMYRFAAERGNFLVGRTDKHSFKADGIELRSNMDITTVKLSKPTEKQLSKNMPADVGITAEQQALIDQANALMNQEQKETVATRFPGLAPSTVVEGDTETTLRGRSMLSEGFSLSKNVTSLFARMADPITELAQVITQGRDKLMELLPADQRGTVDFAEVKAVGELLRHVAFTAQQLNAALADRMNRKNVKSAKSDNVGKSLLDRMLTEKNFFPWSQLQNYSLYATNVTTGENGNTQIGYEPKILQAMALTGLKWGLDNINSPRTMTREDVGDLLGKSEHDVTEFEMNSLAHVGTLASAAQESIGTALMQMMGIQANNTTSKNYATGIPRALAGDVLNAMEAQGLITRDERYFDATTKNLLNNDDNFEQIRKNGGEIKTLVFFKFNRDESPTRWGKGARSLSPLKNLLRLNPYFLDQLFDPGSVEVPSIGKPIQSLPKKISRSKQDISAQQRRALRNEQNTPFKRGASFMEVLNFLGKNDVLTLLGFNNDNLGSYNKIDRLRIEGTNQGLEYQWDNVMAHEAAMAAYAAQNDMQIDDVDTYYGFRMVTNGRIMMNGFSPQSSKLSREVQLRTKEMLDLSNEKTNNIFWLAVAQATGMKIETREHAPIIAEIQRKFTTEGEALYEATALLHEAMSNPDFDSRDELVAALAAVPDMTPRLLNAIEHVGRFMYLMANEDQPMMENGLAIEVDGKTNGPHNALEQFGINEFSEETMENLSLGGHFVNRDDAPTLNTETAKTKAAKGYEDLYAKVSAVAQSLLYPRINRALNRLKDFQNAADIMRSGLNAVVMVRGAKIKNKPNSDEFDYGSLELTRSLGKHPTMAPTYGSGDRSIVENLASQIMEVFYSELSAAAQGNREIEPKMLKMMTDLMGNKTVLNDRYAFIEDVAMPNLSKSNLLQVEFSKDNFDALVNNLTVGIGGAITEATNKVNGPTIRVMKVMQAASQVQFHIANARYTLAYDKLRNQRVAEGKLLPNEVLNQQDENSILTELKDLMPIFELMHTQEGSLDVGLEMLKQSNTGRAQLPDGEGLKKDLAVRSIVGNLQASISTTTLENPGVRASPIFNIASGDGAMMMQMFQKQRDALNVFDGYEARLSDFAEVSNEINEAVRKSWEHNALTTVLSNYERVMKDDRFFDAVHVPAMARSLEVAGLLEFAEVTDPQLFKSMLLNTLTSMEANVRANKEAMNQLASSADQMSGGMNPSVREGLVVDNPVAFVNATAAAIRKTQSARGIEGNSPEFKTLLTNMGKKNDHLVSLDRNAVLSALDKHQFSGVQGFVYKQLRKLIPATLQVYASDDVTTMVNLQHQMLDGAMLNQDGSLWLGASKGNSIFLSQFSPETLLHELVHVTTLSLVEQFYANPSALSAEQQAAVKALDIMMEQFRSMSAPTERLYVETTLQAAQAAVENALQNGDRAVAVNEFMAWALTNQNLNNVLAKRTLADKAAKFVGKVLSAIGKLLGIGSSNNTQNFLANALGQFAALTKASKQLEPTSTKVSAQNIPGGWNAAHDRYLDELSVAYETTLTQFEQASMVNEKAVHESTLMASKIITDFRNAGFSFTPKESLLFSQIQISMAAGLQMDPRTMNVMQDIYSEAMKRITPDTFITTNGVTTNVQQSIAQSKYDALVGLTNRQQGVNGRSTLLANFMALAAVDEQFRKQLQNMKMPKGESKGKDLDTTIRNNTVNLFDYLANAGLGTQGQSMTAAMDSLTARLVAARSTAAAELIEKISMPALEVQNKVKQGMQKIGTMARSKSEQMAQQGRVGKIDAMIQAILLSVDAITTDEGADALGDALLRMSNALPQGATVFAELVREFVGTTDSTHAITEKLNQVKYLVSRVRQRLRDEIPQTVMGWFDTPPTEKQLASMHLVLGQTDLQAALSSFSLDQVKGFLADPQALQAAITGLAASLDTYREGAAYKAAAASLGRYIVLKDNTAPLLLRNADAIAALAGTGVRVPVAQQAAVAPILDALTSLHALALTPAGDRAEIAALFASEGDAMAKVVNHLRTLTRRERGKPGSATQRLNQWKGWVPETRDPRKSLVLVDDRRRAEMELQGYVRVGDYKADATDPAKKMGYYASKSAGMATYNQGALQTVEQSYRGVDFKTGRTLTPNTSTVISSPATVKRITRMKQAGHGGTGLIPIFNDKGEIAAYERVLDPVLIQKHLKSNLDLAQSMGMWEGRIAEEQLAQQFNRGLVMTMKDMWDNEKIDRANEYEAINKAKDNKTKQSWDAIPRDTQQLMRDVFDGDVMVRKDVANNALGYRSASVTDIFSKSTDLPNDVRRVMEETAILLFLGDRTKAYKYLLMGERAWQGLISTAKDWIVVRSLVVALRNGMANQFQLLQNGVPITKLVQNQSRKISEVNTYLKYEKRLAQIHAEQSSTADRGRIAELKRETLSIQDAMGRMSIAPLIQAGELPSIAEGLAETDEFTMISDLTGWMEGKMKDIPAPLVTTAKYAVIAKDTAIYQGLNRAIQYGDFVAKATLYDHLLAQGKTREEALRQISDEFVNYNLLPGRTRTYLESMGLTWFLNYKIRIQKIMFRAIRNNPLAFLSWGTAANMLGAESLFDANAAAIHWEPAFGPGQFFRAHNVLAWNQLLD